MFLADVLTLDAPRRTADGYLVVRARAARTGVYQYAGFEVDPDNKHGLRDKAVVNVLRDDATVFDATAVQSFIGKPVTDNHPTEPVTKDNWRKHARGTIMGALRDGDYLAFDILLTDADAIAKVDAGKRELSNGYGAELEYGEFKAADGTLCQARQSKITGGNHVALVDRGRAGPDCAIKDGIAVCDAITVDALRELAARFNLTERNGCMPHTLIIDGLQVPNVSDEAKAAIEKLQKALADEQAKVATLTTEKATLDAKVTTLETQVADSKLTPAQLRDAAKAYADTVAKAKALGVAVTDSMDEVAIQRAVVAAKIGDAAKDWNDAQIAASYATLTAGVQTTDSRPDPLRQTITDGIRTTVGDTAHVRNAARAARYA